MSRIAPVFLLQGLLCSSFTASQHLRAGHLALSSFTAEMGGFPDDAHDHVEDGLTGAHESIPENYRPSHPIVYVMDLILLSFIFWLGWILFTLYGEYRQAVKTASKDTSSWTFRNYVNYRFAYWFVWTEESKLVVLFVICFLVLVAGTLMYVLFLPRSTLGHACYVIFTLLVEPDAGKNESTWRGRFVACVVSVLALFVFAVLLVAIQDRFNDMLDRIRDGNSQVVEANHFVIIGWCDQALYLLEELCEAYSARNGCVIAVLSEQNKMEVEAAIGQHLKDFKGSRVVVRSGATHSRDSLHSVSCATARTVIVIPDENEEEDLMDLATIQTVLTLRGNEWPEDGRILVRVLLPKNQQILTELGGDRLDIVTLEDFVARCIVQCSRQCGVSSVIKQTLGYQGCEFYLVAAPEAVHGKTFHEAAFHFPNAVLAAVRKHRDASFEGLDMTESAKLWMLHSLEWIPLEYEIQEDDELLLYAENDQDLDASEEPSRCEDFEDAPEAVTLFEVGEYVEESDLGFSYNSEWMITSVDSESWAETKGVHVGDYIVEVNCQTVESYTPETLREALGDAKTITTCHGERTSQADDSVVRVRSSRRFSSVRTHRRSRVGHGAETILLFGWNELCWNLLTELECSVSKGTRVVIYSQKASAERQEFVSNMCLYYGARFNNLHIEHLEGMSGSRFEMEEALSKDLLAEVSRIFVLADTFGMDQSAGKLDPDAGVISAVLHIRYMLADALEDRPHDYEVPLVAEVTDTSAEEHLKKLHVMDFVDSSAIAAQVLSMIAYEPRLSDMLHDLVSETGRMTVAIRHLSDYHEAPKEGKTRLSFHGLMMHALKHGELVLGWTTASREQTQAMDTEVLALHKSIVHNARRSRTINFCNSNGGLDDNEVRTELVWEMNPQNKHALRTWTVSTDQIVVVCERQVAKGPAHMTPKIQTPLVGKRRKSILGTPEVRGQTPMGSRGNLSRSSLSQDLIRSADGLSPEENHVTPSRSLSASSEV